jgi:hypothetical protein
VHVWRKRDLLYQHVHWVALIGDGKGFNEVAKTTPNEYITIVAPRNKILIVCRKRDAA